LNYLNSFDLVDPIVIVKTICVGTSELHFSAPAGRAILAIFNAQLFSAFGGGKSCG
jgi:hypothetical protein